jgi:putative transposase
MKYKRHLPHWLPEGAILHLTWRLSNTLPTPEPDILLRDYVSRAPKGPMWLADPRIAQVVVDALNYGEEHRKLYELFAWVLMPNHVHVLLEPRTELSTITRWLKGRTARTANRILGLTNQPFWSQESYDHIVRSPEEFRNTAYYIEENPVRARLVELPNQWRWSSAWEELDGPQKTMAYRTKTNAC